MRGQKSLNFLLATTLLSIGIATFQLLKKDFSTVQREKLVQKVVSEDNLVYSDPRRKEYLLAEGFFTKEKEEIGHMLAYVVDIFQFVNGKSRLGKEDKLSIKAVGMGGPDSLILINDRNADGVTSEDDEVILIRQERSKIIYENISHRDGNAQKLYDECTRLMNLGFDASKRYLDYRKKKGTEI